MDGFLNEVERDQFRKKWNEITSKLKQIYANGYYENEKPPEKKVSNGGKTFEWR